MELYFAHFFQVCPYFSILIPNLFHQDKYENSIPPRGFCLIRCKIYLFNLYFQSNPLALTYLNSWQWIQNSGIGANLDSKDAKSDLFAFTKARGKIFIWAWKSGLPFASSVISYLSHWWVQGPFSAPNCAVGVFSANLWIDVSLSIFACSTVYNLHTNVSAFSHKYDRGIFCTIL